jgi:cell division protein FtsL
MHGNLAVAKEHKPKAKYIEKTKVVRRRAAIPAQEKLLYLFVIVLCVIIAGSVIWKYAQIYDLQTKIQQIEREMERLEKENQSLKLEVNRLKEPKRLIELGKALGLQPVESESIREIGGGSLERLQRVALRE